MCAAVLSRSSALPPCSEADAPLLKPCLASRAALALEDPTCDGPPISELNFRALGPDDDAEVRQLHAEWFPLKYADDFYAKVQQGIYPTLAATFMWRGEEVIAGLICTATDRGVYEVPLELPYDDLPPTSAYILTLGVVDGYRKRGLAKELLWRCVQHYSQDLACKIVYLHVIPYNVPAIRFYEKFGFLCLEELGDFYTVSNQSYSGYLYGYYINGGALPLSHKVRRSLQSGLTGLSSFFETALTCSVENHVD